MLELFLALTIDAPRVKGPPLKRCARQLGAGFSGLYR